MDNQIVGIEKVIEDPSTGAEIAFYKLSQYTVNIVGDSCNFVLMGYVSKAKHDAGKAMVSHSSYNINSLPVGNAHDWILSRLSTDENQPFHGGILHMIPEAVEG